jgi:hypothetical protein
MANVVPIRPPLLPSPSATLVTAGAGGLGPDGLYVYCSSCGSYDVKDVIQVMVEEYSTEKKLRQCFMRYCLPCARALTRPIAMTKERKVTINEKVMTIKRWTAPSTTEERCAHHRSRPYAGAMVAVWCGPNCGNICLPCVEGMAAAIPKRGKSGGPKR